MTYCLEHFSLVMSDMEVVNTEKSEVAIKKNVQTPHKTCSCLIEPVLSSTCLNVESISTPPLGCGDCACCLFVL